MLWCKISKSNRAQLNESPRSYLEANQLTVHIEWVDSLLLFSHLYSNYDSMATIQRHQIGLVSFIACLSPALPIRPFAHPASSSLPQLTGLQA